jgi:triosephosphate isomerase
MDERYSKGEAMKPILLVNFKTYIESTGKDAVKLAKLIAKIAKQKKADVVIAVEAADIYPVSKAVKIPIYAQHIDPVEEGAHTGAVLAKDVKENGAKGTLLNHSEKRMKYRDLRKSIEIAKKNKLRTVVCVNNIATLRRVRRFKPDYIAIEPPALIGTGISVSTARPGLIRKAVKVARGVPLLCGAGISSGSDVKRALELGASGVLAASAIVKARDQKAVILDMINALR